MNFKNWFYQIEEMYSSKGKGHPFKPGPRDNAPQKPRPSPKDPTPRSLAGEVKLCGQGGEQARVMEGDRLLEVVEAQHHLLVLRLPHHKVNLPKSYC